MCSTCTETKVNPDARNARYMNWAIVAAVVMLFSLIVIPVMVTRHQAKLVPLTVEEKIERIFSPSTLGASIAYFEEVAGPAREVKGHLRQYQLDGLCNIGVVEKYGMVLSVEMKLRGVCDVDLARILYTRNGHQPGLKLWAAGNSPDSVDRVADWQQVGTRCIASQVCWRGEDWGFFYQNGGDFNAANNRMVTLTTPLSFDSPLWEKYQGYFGSYHEQVVVTDNSAPWYTPVGVHDYPFTELVVTGNKRESDFIRKYSAGTIDRIRYETFIE